MSKIEFFSKITNLFAPLLEAEGLELWGLEVTSGPRPVLRVYIDAQGGASIDQCAEISRLAGLALEVEDLFSGPYVLEVSSPGMERLFFSADQLSRYIGERIDLALHAPVEDFPRRKRFFGKLAGYDAGVFSLELEGEGKGESAPVLRFQWEDVKKARLVCFLPEEQAEKGAKKPASPKAKKAKGPSDELD